ncbi:MAG: GNAT family N-acetyltransferase [Bacteroidetes bacterium]|nr:GNAT family N-acetyltransferase [Bacteroidota bacterium]MCK5765326.1 GNAT family N-acetyltransferase [Bacteroidales bacterium]
MRSENLQLRALEPSDIDLLYKWENDTSIWHLSNTLAPFSRFALEQYVMNAGDDIFATRQLRLMIDLHTEDPARTIGCIDLFDFDPVNLRAGLGILFVEQERGKGFASEALDIMIDYAFSRLKLHQLFSNVISGNTASLELFKKKQFSVIGVKKEWLWSENAWIDEYLLQLINKNS